MNSQIQSRVRSLLGVATVDRLLTVLTVFSETLRAYPWIILLSSLSIVNWVEPPFSFLSSLIIIAAVTFTLSFMLPRGFSINEVRIAALSVGIILVLLVIRLEINGGYAFWDVAWFDYASTMLVAIVAGLIFGIFLIWRGISISREDLRTDYLYKNFIFGIASFALLLFIWALTSDTNTNKQLFTTLIPYILGYFFTSLMGMGISNFLRLRRGMAGQQKATELFARRWLLILLGVVTGILIIGSIIASSFSLNLISWLVGALGTLAGWILIGFLYAVGYPLGFLVEGIYWVGIRVINWLLERLGGNPFQQIDTVEFGEKTEEIVSGNFPSTIFAIVQWVLLAAVLGAVIYFLYRAIFRYWRGPQDKGFEEVNESLWSWKGFGNDVKDFLNGLTDRFRRGSHPVPPLACIITEPRALEIREIYRGLLWEGDHNGFPRFRSQTPYEYQSYLESRFGDQKASLTAITSAYVGYRYGQIPVESEENDLTLVKWWLDLRSAIRAAREGEKPA